METILQCQHSPRVWKLEYLCEEDGNYTLELCENCHEEESKNFLIKEEKILEERLT
jgi:hypothetical protein